MCPRCNNGMPPLPFQLDFVKARELTFSIGGWGALPNVVRILLDTADPISQEPYMGLRYLS